MKSCESSAEADDGVWVNFVTGQVTYPNGIGQIVRMDKFGPKDGSVGYGMSASTPEGKYGAWFWELSEDEPLPDSMLLPSM